MVFGEKLKQLRMNNGYSQEQLADLLNVSRQAITKWENQKGMPDISNLKAIAELFDVTIDSLIDDIEEIETTDENFCWKLCFAIGILGFVLGWFLTDIAGMNIGTFGIGGGIIGYILGYIILEIKKKLR